MLIFKHGIYQEKQQQLNLQNDMLFVLVQINMYIFKFSNELYTIYCLLITQEQWISMTQISYNYLQSAKQLL